MEVLIWKAETFQQTVDENNASHMAPDISEILHISHMILYLKTSEYLKCYVDTPFNRKEFKEQHVHQDFSVQFR